MKLPTFKSEIRFGLPMLPLYVDAAAVAFIQKPAKVCGKVFYSQSMMWMTENGSKGEVILPRDEYEKMWEWINKHRDKVHKQHKSWERSKGLFFQKVNKLIFNKERSIHLFTELFEEYVSLYAIASMTEGGLVGSEFIVKKLINMNVSKDDTASLVGPKTLSFLGENKLSLLKLAENFPNDVVLFSDLEKKYLSTSSKINQHSQKFHWILNNYKDVQILPSEFFFNQIKEIHAQKIRTKLPKK